MHEFWMQQALVQARSAGEAGEIPVGAIVVDPTETVIGVGQNRKERDRDPLAHAEILAIQEATRTLQQRYLQACRLYVTLEPCPMCTGALLLARVGTVIYGTPDPKTGALGSAIDIPGSPAAFHRVTVIGNVLQTECQQLLQEWFRSLRQRKQVPS